MDSRPPTLARTPAIDVQEAEAAVEIARAAPPAAASTPRIAVLRNPRSHRNRGAPVSLPETPGVRVVTPDDRAGLGDALVGLAREGVDILVIDGGDGTIRDVLTRGAAVFGDAWPRLIVLPKGKTNALAVDLGVPREWTLAVALAAARQGAVVRRRPLVVECEDVARRTLWGFVFGAGAFNAAIETGQVAHRLGAFQGFAVGLSVTFGIAQAVFGFGGSAWRRVSPMRLSIGPGGAPLPHSRRGDAGARYVALFSTLREFPLRIMPFRREDPAIRYLVLDSASRRLLARLPAILWGAPTPGDPALGIHRGHGEAFALDLTREGFILDGEAFPPGRLRLRQGPPLEFIVPAS